MKKAVLFFILFISLTVSAQKEDSLEKQMRASMATLDSTTANLQQSIATSQKAIDSINNDLAMKQNNRNLDSFMQEMKERNEKEKRASYLRLGFAAILVGVGIYSLVRKKKKGNKAV